MSDKMILIIFLAINCLMWICVADWMRKTNKNTMEFIMKSDEYQHKTFLLVSDVTKVNVNSMDKFIRQISAIIEQKKTEGEDEAEDRERIIRTASSDNVL